jgi:small multidrug resistance family-3 protein
LYRADRLICRRKGKGSFVSMSIFHTLGLFVITALAEIVGCYLPYLWLRESRSAWLLIPAAASLALFAWLLSLHPTAAGRVYAAYGGVYVSVALVWLWRVDGVRPHLWDVVGVAVTLLGMGIIMLAPRGA